MKLKILLVGDNPGDIRLTQEAFKTVNIDIETTLHIITNGDDAVDFLHKRAHDETSLLPDPALVDLNLLGKYVISPIQSNIPTDQASSSDYTHEFCGEKRYQTMLRCQRQRIHAEVNHPGQV